MEERSRAINEWAESRPDRGWDVSPEPPTAAEVVGDTDLQGSTVLVTGATSGLGLETARVLAARGARLLLVGRDPDRLEDAQATVAAGAPVVPDTVMLDLADLSSVRAAAARVRGRVDTLDVLVNNAGVMFTPLRRTSDGFEEQLGTNHLGHFLLTRELVGLLRAAAAARVVTLSSDGHGLADVDLTDLHWQRREYNKFAAYGASKTANMLFTVALDRREREHGVRAYAVHPGSVVTELARHMDRDDHREMARLAGWNTTGGEVASGSAAASFLTPAQGAATTVWAATSPTLAGQGGLYLTDCAVTDRVSPYAVDPDRAEELWEVSTALVDENAMRGL